MGCPEAEHHPSNAIPFGDVGTHPLPDVVVVALGEQVAIHLAHPLIAEGPGIVLLMGDATALNPDSVAGAWVDADACFKHPGVIGAGHGDLLTTQQQGHAVGLRHPHTDRPSTVRRLGAEHSEGVVMTTVRQSFAVLNHPVEDCRAAHGRPIKWARC